METYKTALSEMSRVLKSNGTFVIEVDAKYNADLVWTVVDSLMFGLLHYETTLRDALNAALSRPKAHIKVQYPFGGDGDPIYMNLRLFTRKGLVEDLRQCGLEAVHTLSIHSLTNIIPSTFLDDGTPSNSLKRVFNLLASIEERLPFYLPGCSIVIFGKKTASPAHV